MRVIPTPELLAKKITNYKDKFMEQAKFSVNRKSLMVKKTSLSLYR